MTKTLRLAILALLTIAFHSTTVAQSVSINTTGATAANSAMLDVSSTTKGVLIPRMDKTQKNAIASPANGLLVYQTGPDSIGFHYYDQPNTRWVFINASGFATDTTAWKLTGNNNATSASFLGTTNDTALRFRVRNTASGIVDSTTANTTLGFNSNTGITTGLNNTFMGYRAGILNDTTSNSTFIGFYAGERNRNNNNVAVGAQAGRYYSFSNQSTSEMTAVGTEAGHGAFINPKSTAVGFRALYSRQGGSLHGSSVGRNTAVGDSAMAWAGFGQSNVAIGTETLGRVDNGNFNVSIGDSSMAGALNTDGNVAIGYKTLSYQQAQGYNTAVGFYSQRDSSVNTYYNTSIGAYSMEFNRTGIYNTGLGLSALRNADSASFNTAVGADAMYNHRGLNGYNTALGSYALRGDSVGFWNTAIGSQAMDRAGLDGSDKGTGFSNVAVGFRALRGAREAFENTAVGVGALESDSSGNYNTAVGRYASFLNKRGDFNVSVGYRASNDADTAINTVAVGSYALSYNKQDNNVAIGYAAGYTAGALPSANPKEITFIGYEAGRGSWATNKNTAIGFRALSNSDASFGYYDYTTGRNTVIGDSAMAFSIGGSNVVVGTEALSYSDLGGTWNNVAIGDSAMGGAKSNSGALYDNVAVGFKSLTRVKNQGNVAVGAYAGNELANTIWNTAIGYHALETDTTGNENTVVGTSAFRNNARGIRNVSLGINTGYWATGDNNTYLGSYAGQGISGRSTGSSNVAVGDYAMLNARSAAQNVAVGESALGSDSTGNLNVAVGAGAMDQRLRGNENVGVGFWAGRLDTASINSVYIGSQAGYNNNRSNIVAVGYQALYSNGQSSTLSQGLYNTAVGSFALSDSRKGIQSTALGYLALTTDTSSGSNTALGAFAAYQNTSGSSNTAVGSSALSSNTTGGFNTALGQAALAFHQKNNSNVALGSNALFNDTTGASNIAVGTNAMISNSNGSFNTAVGTSSLSTNTIGTNNTGLGYFTNVSAINLTNATAIGYRALAGASNSLVLGSINGVNGATSDTKVGIGTTTPDSTLSVTDNFLVGSSGTVQFDNSVPVMNYMFKSGFSNADRMVIAHSTAAPNWGLQYQDATDQFNFIGSGLPRLVVELGTGSVGLGMLNPTHQLQLSLDDAAKPGTSTWTIVSDERLKIINGAYKRGLNDILKLNTIEYNYKADNQFNLPFNKQFVGFTAQEVQKVFPEAVTTDKNGYLNLNMHPLLVAYVNAFKEQQQIIDNQQKNVDELKKKNEQLEKDMQLIKAKLGINN